MGKPVGSISVRGARRSDRDEIVRMRQSFWPDSTAAEVDELLARGARSYVVLVAERLGSDGGGRLCGFAEVGTRPYAEGCDSSPVAYLEGIWVDADARRVGVGAALVREADGWARAQGLIELASDTELVNSTSQAFHEAMGFEEAERLVAYRRRVPERPR